MKAVAGSSTSATTAPAPSTSTGRLSATTSATASRHRPSSSTSATARSTSSTQSSAEAAPYDDQMVLLERESPLGSIAEYFSDATSGHGRMVFIGGEAGVGKTTFVDRSVSDTAGSAHVARGACDGSSTPAPLGPLREMLASLPAGIWPERSDRSEVFTRLAEALSRAARPYVLVVEDVHWADEATLDLLRFFARRVHRLPVLVLVTFRSEEAVGSHPLRVLLGDVGSCTGLRRIDLRPLSVRAVLALVEEAGATAVLDVEELHEVTGGNP